MTTPVSLDRTPPTTTAYVIATAIVAGVTGYFIGQGASLGLFKEKQGWPNGYDVKVHKDSSEEEDEGSDSEEDESDSEEGNGEELANFKDNTDEVKLVLVVRTDLGMTKGMLRYAMLSQLAKVGRFPMLTARFLQGKIAAQASHATLACYKYFLAHSPDSPILRRWERNGQAKIALQVKSEDELLLLQAQAMSLGLCARVIQDAGRTQIAGGSRTVLGVLGPKSVVDGVTGHLKLL